MHSISRTSSSQACRWAGVLVTTTAKFLRKKSGTPHNPKMQFFQRVSRGSPKTASSRSRGVLEVVNTTAALAWSSPTGTPSPAVPLPEPVGHLRPEHPVHPALQDGRRLAPPVGMDDDDALGLGDLPAVLRQVRVQEGLPLEFGRQQDGVEVFLVEVMEPDLMPLGLQGLHRGGGDGVVEAAVPGMSQNYRKVGHLNSEGRRGRVTSQKVQLPYACQGSVFQPQARLAAPWGGGAWLAERNQKIEEFLKRRPRNTAGKTAWPCTLLRIRRHRGPCPEG